MQHLSMGLIEASRYFSGFLGSEEALEKITRFARLPVMYYRTNDLLHSQRVWTIVKDIAPHAIETYGKGFDAYYTAFLPLCHEHTEILRGDIPLDKKLRMTSSERKDHIRLELEAIDELGRIWPERVNGFFYRDLLLGALFKETAGDQLCSYADKIDGYCETVHETLAGNPAFLEPLNNYEIILKERYRNFPKLHDLFSADHPFFKDPVPVTAGSGPHTLQSLLSQTGIPQYDRWKGLTLKYFGLEPLLKVKE